MTAAIMGIGTPPPGTAIPHDLLLQLLGQTLGAEVELAGCQIANQQHDTLVLLLQLRRPTMKVVVKLAGLAAPLAAAFERTAMLQRLVAAQTTIPMPETLAVDTSCRAWPWRYCIKTHIPGQEWATARRQMTGDELSDAYRRIGSAVAQLHTIHFPAFGELTAAGDVQGDQPYPAALRAHARARSSGARACATCSARRWRKGGRSSRTCSAPASVTKTATSTTSCSGVTGGGGAWQRSWRQGVGRPS